MVLLKHIYLKEIVKVIIQKLDKFRQVQQRERSIIRSRDIMNRNPTCPAINVAVAQ